MKNKKLLISLSGFCIAGATVAPLLTLTSCGDSCQIKFVCNNGTFDGTTTLTLPKGTRFATIAMPLVTPKDGYKWDGKWFNGDTELTHDSVINKKTTITVNCEPIQQGEIFLEDLTLIDKRYDTSDEVKDGKISYVYKCHTNIDVKSLIVKPILKDENNRIKITAIDKSIVSDKLYIDVHFSTLNAMMNDKLNFNLNFIYQGYNAAWSTKTNDSYYYIAYTGHISNKTFEKDSNILVNQTNYTKQFTFEVTDPSITEQDVIDGLITANVVVTTPSPAITLSVSTIGWSFASAGRKYIIVSLSCTSTSINEAYIKYSLTIQCNKASSWSKTFSNNTMTQYESLAPVQKTIALSQGVEAEYSFISYIHLSSTSNISFTITDQHSTEGTPMQGVEIVPNSTTLDATGYLVSTKIRFKEGYIGKGGYTKFNLKISLTDTGSAEYPTLNQQINNMCLIYNGPYVSVKEEHKYRVIDCSELTYKNIEIKFDLIGIDALLADYVDVSLYKISSTEGYEWEVTNLTFTQDESDNKIIHCCATLLTNQQYEQDKSFDVDYCALVKEKASGWIQWTDPIQLTINMK